MEAGTLTPDVSRILGSQDLANRLDRKEGLTDLPPAPTTSAVGGQATAMAVAGSPPRALEARALLAQPQREEVEAYARQVFPKLLDDPNQLDALGSDAVEQINA